jgi:hypothetical protein
MIMKKWFDFAIVCLYILGAIGGVGFAIAGDSLPCAAGVVMLAIIAFPRFKQALKSLGD